MPTPVPPPPDRTAPISHRPRSLPFDRLVILLLGACGCVLSFDSLRQVALATHVRPDLSYLFPVVIDGFIAYGVRAILLLRDAPRSARLYAWTLFGTATAAPHRSSPGACSAWPNAPHRAVKLERRWPAVRSPTTASALQRLRRHSRRVVTQHPPTAAPAEPSAFLGPWAKTAPRKAP
ncbi:DUF2637 domain-containing protein [Streptomyces cocklensis]|uniref:DUF2637 domain-containing protein n=1 Tax=Actinacidiphila cocklensis TaxID=887465 RepID=A0A9W4DWN3_9ACTN|nr:DUF2637 domain-containing protein [Actinacidiphila cocklensis]MDD1062940.1 DUF2637 domain-containing protein [Actinacidiphila cocklensis]CAG6394872.1 hypothetical protein SCOCK_30105 [Actinacidiphila cocklensis]